MVKHYNGETYIIPQAFEDEVRADEREKVLNETLEKIIEVGDVGSWVEIEKSDLLKIFDEMKQSR